MTETTTQVERVARAMAANDSGPEGSTLFDIHWREFGEGYLSGATAAINAMSEPTMAMLNAAVDATEAGAGMSWVNRSPQKLFQVGYQAMLANALAPQPHTAPMPHEQGRDEVERLREALAWYGEQARLARLIHSEGDAGRHALAGDGGKRARAALSPPLS